MSQPDQPRLMSLDGLAPGDILAVDTGPSAVEKLIEIGAKFKGLPALDNHIVILHHKDVHGRWQGLEGRPSNVGWTDCTKYLNHPATVSNQRQPKTPLQRAVLIRRAEALIGVGYDWQAILANANRDIGLNQLWAPDSEWYDPITGYPGHVICSSYAAWDYIGAELDHPDVGHERVCQPGEWVQFIWDHQDEWLAAA
jgi:hypothetical protein